MFSFYGYILVYYCTMMCLYSRTADLTGGAANTNVAGFVTGIVSAMLSHKEVEDVEDGTENETEKTHLKGSKWMIVKQHVLPTRNI